MPVNRQESGKIAREYVIRNLEERDYKVEKNRTCLSVKSPKGKDFAIKVTSLSKPNPWIVSDPKDQNSYFVLVYKPEGESPDFFVLSSDEMRKEKQRHFSSMKHPFSEYSNPELEKMGLSFMQLDRYGFKNRWATLPK
jgi:hypothetical protein